MALSNTQAELLTEIRNRLQRGDIKAIAAKTKIARENVGRALNINADFFNEAIVEAAMKVILEREQKATKHLASLTA